MTHDQHWRKGNSRYYKVITHKDMFSQYTLTCIWGGLHSRLGNYKKHTFDTQQEIDQFITDLCKRRELRGYTKITADTQTVHGFG